MWVRRELPGVPFCRYADDGLLHCKSKEQASFPMHKLTQRLIECGLEIHPDKSRIIYCKDTNRQGGNKEISFDFLGYTFRPRRCIDKNNRVHPNFLPAISNTSKKEINRVIRSRRIQRNSDKTISDISKMFNPIIIGWHNYYGRFYPSALHVIWKNLNNYLVRWVQRKLKRFAKHKKRARDYINRIARSNPHLFIHWKQGFYPGGSDLPPFVITF